MRAYLEIVDKILKEGILCPNRTGVSAYTIAGATFEHDMEKGFPLLTTKQMGLRNISSELEFFIRGITDKNWLRDKKITFGIIGLNPNSPLTDMTKKAKIK